MTGSEEAQPRFPWDQQPGEPDRWYGRFQIYLGLGPTRNFLAAYRKLPGNSSKHGDGDWSARAAQWRWRERAHAWDVWQRELLALSERNLRAGLHYTRVGVTEETLDAIRAALDAADIAGADQQTAREWLPQLRVFLRDMLVVQRQEFEHDFTGDDPAAAAALTADDLRAAQRQLEGGAVLAGAPAAPLPASQPRDPEERKARTFLVCAGPGRELLLDLAVLRAVRAATGLQFTRLLNTTRSALHRSLSRQRSFGHPIQYIHMALHATAAGLELADGPVDGAWLSERLEGVRVLLLASCAGDSIGDWLGVVPYVITLGEDIPNEDAAALAQHFWHGIGLGQEPGAALDAALAHCPPDVGEYVVRHW